MNLPYFIARRTAQGTPGSKPGVMERIAVVSVSLSVTVMILAMAVIMGFKQEVSRKVTAFAAHISVTGVKGVGTIDSQPVRRSAYTEGLIRSTPGFVSLTPFAVKGGIVRTADAVEGIMLKGVDSLYDWSSFEEWMIEGELPRVGEEVRTKDILLSRNLARRLMLGVGDKVEMLFVEAGDTPRRDRFKVAGIYSSGMDEMDNTIVMTDLRNVQRLADWSDYDISGYEVFTTNLNTADTFARNLGRTLLYDEAEDTENLAVSSVTELYPNIFDWLKAHDVNAAVIIVIMLVVAFFNMTSALLILVLERTRMIGLLKAFGMRNGSVRQIFLWRAAFITLRGLMWGNAVGLGLCLIQKYFHLVKLSSEGYLLSEVPVSLAWGWWLVLNIGVIVAIVALLVVPTYIVSSVKPDESIRYE
ncbi:FtsX-like permease family protein [uncultured Alistipes sp.]|uniref:ABC transporter permease n=1 Tax=uncultured Alistipes sp. TaxID=538949 RepID=UPI0025D8EFB3|nr:FtsX-like permease family protein [uncultured Alistipes sp.]